MKRHIYTQVDYNLWATKKLVGFCRDLSTEYLMAPIANSFPTLKDTILHIYAAEKTWIRRMQGNPPKVWPAFDFKGETNEILDLWLKSSSDLKEYVDKQSEKKLLSTSTYTSYEGPTISNTMEQILYHVINHSTYHRGQLVTISKQLGISGAPSSDLFYYYNDV